MTINKQKVLDDILGNQKPEWDENAKNYPEYTKAEKKPLFRKEKSDTENAFDAFQVKANAKINAEKTALEWARQVVAAKTDRERTLILGALEEALIKVDECQF